MAKSRRRIFILWGLAGLLYLLVGLGARPAYAQAPGGWREVLSERPLTLAPELVHSVWERSVPPNANPYDRIRLHRLVKQGARPGTAVFIFPGTWSSGDQLTSDDLAVVLRDSIQRRRSKEPNRRKLFDTLESELQTFFTRSAVHVLAEAGYDVYSMDYRTHFVDKSLNPNEVGFMRDWGWKMFVSDGKSAIEAAKAISNFPKLYLAGESFGGMLAMVYASEYWDKDLLGLILLDGGGGGRWKIRIPMELWKLVEGEVFESLPDLPDFAVVDGQLSPAFLQALIDVAGRQLIYQTGSYAMDGAMDYGPLNAAIPILTRFLNVLGVPLKLNFIPHYAQVAQAVNQDPLAPPVDPVTGEFLRPFDPKTGRPFSSYLEWSSETQFETLLPGIFGNLDAGENTRLGLGYIGATFDRYWPMEVYLESIKMFEFELTSSDETLGLLGFQLDPLMLPGAVSQSLTGVSGLLKSQKNPMLKVGEVQNPQRTLRAMLESANLGNSSGNSSVPNYQQNFGRIDIPLIAFASRLGLTLWGPFNPGIASQDVTNGGEYPFLGHLDIYFGTHNYELVNGPVLDWLARHTTSTHNTP